MACVASVPNVPAAPCEKGIAKQLLTSCLLACSVLHVPRPPHDLCLSLFLSSTMDDQSLSKYPSNQGSQSKPDVIANLLEEEEGELECREQAGAQTPGTVALFHHDQGVPSTPTDVKSTGSGGDEDGEEMVLLSTLLNRVTFVSGGESLARWLYELLSQLPSSERVFVPRKLVHYLTRSLSADPETRTWNAMSLALVLRCWRKNSVPLEIETELSEILAGLRAWLAGRIDFAALPSATAFTWLALELQRLSRLPFEMVDCLLESLHVAATFQPLNSSEVRSFSPALVSLSIASHWAAGSSIEEATRLASRILSLERLSDEGHLGCERAALDASMCRALGACFFEAHHDPHSEPRVDRFDSTRSRLPALRFALRVLSRYAPVTARLPAPDSPPRSALEALNYSLRAIDSLSYTTKPLFRNLRTEVFGGPQLCNLLAAAVPRSIDRPARMCNAAAIKAIRAVCNNSAPSERACYTRGGLLVLRAVQFVSIALPGFLVIEDSERQLATLVSWLKKLSIRRPETSQPNWRTKSPTDRGFLLRAEREILAECDRQGSFDDSLLFLEQCFTPLVAYSLRSTILLLQPICPTQAGVRALLEFVLYGKMSQGTVKDLWLPLDASLVDQGISTTATRERQCFLLCMRGLAPQRALETVEHGLEPESDDGEVHGSQDRDEETDAGSDGELLAQRLSRTLECFRPLLANTSSLPSETS